MPERAGCRNLTSHHSRRGLRRASRSSGSFDSGAVGYKAGMSLQKRGVPAEQVPTVNSARPADTPLEVASSGWRETFQQTRKRLTRDRVSMAAGSLAYHFFLALFPAVIAALGVLTLVSVGGGTLTHLINGIGKALPPGTAAVFQSAVRAATRRAAGTTVAVVVGVVVSLWSASSAMSVLQQALDVAYEVPRDRKFLARRLHALPLMALVAVLGGASAAMIVFAQPIGSAIEGVLPIKGIAFAIGWTAVRWVLTFVLIMLLLSVLYFLGPNRERPRWQWVSPGGIVATAVFLLASLGFSFYVSAFGSYGRTYGTFAGVAILIFWLYLTGFAVLLGAELNAELERQAAQGARATESAGAPAGRGRQATQMAS